MFSFAVGGSVDGVARQMDVSVSPEQRNELIVQIEDEALPDEVAKIISEAVPNLKNVVTAANVEAFEITLGVLVAVLLLALLIASFLPRVEPDEVAAPDVKQKVADVSSKRL
jgi:hypothetical protein